MSAIDKGAINHVSDTALMVAACRAVENDLQDGFVRDPFAGRLAGERGRAILNALPYANVARMGLSIRARFVDELLQEALAAHRIATMLSLGCGLDTRPWRLDLPAHLRWIEVDFTDILDYKEKLMSGETTRCRRERLVADINDPQQRRAVYAAVGAEPSLMITEGLLMYLPAKNVDELADEASSQCGVRHWITDVTTTGFRQALGGGTDTMSPIRHVQASDALTGEQTVEVLQSRGWISEAHRSYITDVGFAQERVRRMMGGKTPPPPPFPPNDPSGAHRFGRSHA